MKDFIDLYLEAWMIGLVGITFVYLVVSLSRKVNDQQRTLEQLRTDASRQTDATKNVEGIIVKLIDRWGRSDEVMDRRHESVTRDLHDLRNDVSYLRGRGSSRSPASPPSPAAGVCFEFATAYRNSPVGTGINVILGTVVWNH